MAAAVVMAAAVDTSVAVMAAVISAAVMAVVISVAVMAAVITAVVISVVANSAAAMAAVISAAAASVGATNLRRISKLRWPDCVAIDDVFERGPRCKRDEAPRTLIALSTPAIESAAAYCMLQGLFSFLKVSQ
jgi:hypothetical protein